MAPKWELNGIYDKKDIIGANLKLFSSSADGETWVYTEEDGSAIYKFTARFLGTLDEEFELVLVNPSLPADAPSPSPKP